MINENGLRLKGAALIYCETGHFAMSFPYGKQPPARVWFPVA
jgi:hypothetical protein